MTATNMCSNFGGFRCRPPLIDGYVDLDLYANKCMIMMITIKVIIINNPHKGCAKCK